MPVAKEGESLEFTRLSALFLFVTSDVIGVRVESNFSEFFARSATLKQHWQHFLALTYC